MDQVINRYIKEVALVAGLTEKVEIEKYKLIHTHTARRTGATLMYLAGVDLYDIMKVTGHTSPAMLKKYIKATIERTLVDLLAAGYIEKTGIGRATAYVKK